MTFVVQLQHNWLTLREPLYTAIAASAAGKESSVVLKQLLRQHKTWNQTQRWLCKEIILGIAVWRLRLEAQGASTPAQLLGLFLQDCKQSSTQETEELIHERLPKLCSTLSFAARHALPEWLAALWREEFGEEAEALATASNLVAPVFVRANTEKISRDCLQRQLAREGVESQPCRYVRTGLQLLSEQPNIYGLPSYQEGLFEVQDEGSQWLVEAAAVLPGMSVLDYCAGAGGKTLGLAAVMKNKGRLVAYDPDAKKRQQLRARVARAGARCVRICDEKPSPRETFDVVFVDAPCSQLGVLRRSPDARRNPLQTLEGLQYEILRDAALYVKPQGRLLYATCTLRRAENEDLVQRFAQEQAHFLPTPLCDITGNEVLSAHCLPHRHSTDGFFAAMFQRINAPDSFWG